MYALIVIGHIQPPHHMEWLCAWLGALSASDREELGALSCRPDRPGAVSVVADWLEERGMPRGWACHIVGELR